VIDSNPPVAPLSPEQSITRVQLPPGFQLQLVASEPVVQEPVALAWDGNGRMYVAEMNSFMKDVNATGEYEPISRIKLLEDTNADGKIDKYTVFIDSLLLPRVILPVGDELFVQLTNVQHIWSYKDTNGDGKADEKRIVFKNDVADVRNLEHQNGGLLWNLDNWIYPSRDNMRYKYRNGLLIADTMTDNMIGQWGMTTDNYGRLYYSEAGPGLPAVQFQQLPAYGALNFKDQYSESFTIPWPVIGNLDAQGGRKALRPDDNTLKKFTSGCGQSIFRGHSMPEDMQGDYFIAEPVGRVVKRGNVVIKNGKRIIEDVYKEKDWLASADMNFRPVNTYTGPDGCFYIVDMYHGIIQESEWTEPGSYLRSVIEDKGLYKNRGMGRIYRVVHQDYPPDNKKPDLLDASSSTLVGYLRHPNGWWRDNAQQLLILRDDATAIPLLKEMASPVNTQAEKTNDHLATIHALWTLQGMNSLDRKTLLKALKHDHPQVRKTAVWISEAFIEAGDAEVMRALYALKDDPDADVMIQLSLSLRAQKSKESASLLTELLAKNSDNELMQFSFATFRQADSMRKAEYARIKNLSLTHRKLVKQGATIFKQLCASCHGSNGRGVKMVGSPMPAPPLAGSPRVRGDKIMNIQLLLNGLKGPVDGKTYPDIMPSMAAQDDEWIASVLSYVRNSSELGNASSVVTPEEVKTVRASTPKIPGGMTLQQLEIFKLGRAENKNWDRPLHEKKETPKATKNKLTGS
jgi:mono/diheme cytochrome c family protein/glucose/arabinose dehydrogenase